jgi:hypothetical protein
LKFNIERNVGQKILSMGLTGKKLNYRIYLRYIPRLTNFSRIIGFYYNEGYDWECWGFGLWRIFIECNYYWNGIPESDN